MGATVSTAKLIGAFLNRDGHPRYVMFEQTYCKNVYPRTPRWSAVAIGDLSATIRLIFQAASACEGGMLQGAGGRTITPEGYIAGWLKELANPVVIEDRSIELQVSDRFYATLPQGAFDKIRTTLLARGEHETVATLESGGSVTVSLHQDADMLCSIYDGESAGAWRIFDSGELRIHGQRDPSLGYTPRKVKVSDVAVPRFRKVHPAADYVLEECSDGSWICVGWEYSVIAGYVTSLWEDEMREPGSYRARMKAFRASLDSAPYISERGMQVVVDTSVALDDYKRRNVERTLQELSHTRQGNAVYLDVPATDTGRYRVANLPTECTRWVALEPHSAPHHAPQSQPFTQLSLLA